MACLMQKVLSSKVSTNINSKLLSSILRSVSSWQTKIVENSNGERIITHSREIPNFVEMPIAEYVWSDVNNYSSKDALVCGITGRKYTYAEARDFSNYVARSLRNMGFKSNDVLALIMPNMPEFPIAFFGISEAGIIVSTMNPTYTIDEISRQLSLSGTKGIITSANIADSVIEAAKENNIPKSSIIVADYPGYSIPDGTIPFPDLFTKGKTLPPLSSVTQSVNDTAVLPFSSGTTGLPKGVMLTHKNLVSNLQMCSYLFEGDIYQTTTDSHQDVVPAILPLFHSYGMTSVMLQSMKYGSKLVSLPKFVGSDFIKLLTDHKATIGYVVPPLVTFLTSSKDCKRKHVESFKRIFCGAAPLSESDAEQFYDKFNLDKNTMKFTQGYGMTETSPVTTFEMSGKKHASIGKNIVGCDIRIVDPTTNKDVSGPHKNGEIWIRGPHIMKGYWNNQKATDEIFENGWLKSGDIAYYDENLDFYVTDRMKDLIKVSGFQVAPAELEGLLRSHPEIEEAAVIGIPDPRYGEVPKAFVVTQTNKRLTEEDVQNFVKGKVSDFKELRGGVTFVDSIPKNPTGKIMRKELRTMFANK